MAITKDELWGSEEEAYQWAAVLPMVSGEQSDEDAIIYVRKDAPPAKAMIWYGDGSRADELEEDFNQFAEKEYEPRNQPFLFAMVLGGNSFSQAGKLDDKSKAMLKERFNVDVDTDG